MQRRSLHIWFALALVLWHAFAPGLHRVQRSFDSPQSAVVYRCCLAMAPAARAESSEERATIDATGKRITLPKAKLIDCSIGFALASAPQVCAPALPVYAPPAAHHHTEPRVEGKILVCRTAALPPARAPPC